ncbi:hypothetical protein QBC32DRAFT_374619 [Pseudoneurospora amorphoporcata]|uniref:Uncharacterized protein n=1 Tax=Pseudoneurospora amorphoporcata TaxID=241081 RepID=A0AAN6NKV9_9PEZI|nr:hypothetical protein QBC32DRAFT_374619 [Pseudoneurospora amorphoporcata]
MSYQTPTRGLTATTSSSTQPDAHTFPAMEHSYHNQTPGHNVYPDTNGSSYSDLDCNHQQYPGASPTGNEAWLNNDQAFLTDMGVSPGFVNQCQPAQYASQQQYQSQVIPTVPVMPPSHPAAYPASPGGTANLKTEAQAQTTSWNFTNELEAELHDDLSLLTGVDLNTRASSQFVDVWTSQAAQMSEAQKYFNNTGHSVEFPVDLTSFPPPRYTSTSPKSTEDYGYSQYDNPYLIPESGPQWGDAWYSNNQSDPNIHGPFNLDLVSPADMKPKQEMEAANTGTRDTANIIDLTDSPPPAYTAADSPFYQPRPQSSPQNNAVRGLIQQSEKDLSTLSDFINDADIKLEQEAYQDDKDKNSKEEEKQEYEVKQECEEEQHEVSVKQGYPTPYSALPTSASTPSQQPGNEEPGLSDQVVPDADNFLEMCEDVWQNQAKPAIAAMLSKRKHNIASRDDRVEFVMQCLDDLTEINSENVHVEPCGAPNMPPSPPNSKRRRRGSEEQDGRQSEERRSKRRCKERIKYLQSFSGESAKSYLDGLKRMNMLPGRSWMLKQDT